MHLRLTRESNQATKKPSKDSTSSSGLAPTMPNPVPVDIPVPNLAPTVPSPEPVDSPAPTCFEDDEQDEDDQEDRCVWIWPGKYMFQQKTMYEYIYIDKN